VNLLWHVLILNEFESCRNGYFFLLNFQNEKEVSADSSGTALEENNKGGGMLPIFAIRHKGFEGRFED